MPSPTPAIDIIKSALRKLGVLATGETPRAEEATDGLRALNDVLETWSTQSLAVYSGLPETFVTVPGQATYTVGPGGNWDTIRPQSIDGAYTTVQGVDFPIGPWTLEQYDAVAVKYQRQQIAERLVFINDAPLARIILYPTPNAAVPITINTPRLLAQVPTIATILSLPPGYVRALQYAVAVELAPEYGSPIDLTAQARSTLALIKRANRVEMISSFDSALTGGGRAIPARGY